MRDTDFFQGITHVPIPWGERSIHVPVFYRDIMSISAQFLAPLGPLRSLLPSRRLHPLRLTPWHGVVGVSAFAYRDSDIGPYNELSVSIPFSLDRPSPLFVGTLNKEPPVPSVYIRHLPVTTEIARDAGIEFAAYPKFLADITFEENVDWLCCRLALAGEPLLSLTCRSGTTEPAGRGRVEIYNLREGRLLRCEMMIGECQRFASRKPSDVRLELQGNHPITHDLRGLRIVRPLGCQVVPHAQAILSPVLESLPA